MQKKHHGGDGQALHYGLIMALLRPYYGLIRFVRHPHNWPGCRQRQRIRDTAIILVGHLIIHRPYTMSMPLRIHAWYSIQQFGRLLCASSFSTHKNTVVVVIIELYLFYFCTYTVKNTSPSMVCLQVETLQDTTTVASRQQAQAAVLAASL